MASALLEDPSGYGRVVRDSDGSVLRVAETKTDGDATPQELEIREVNTGVYVFSGAALRAALPRLTADNAQGELYLPQALDLIRADGAKVAAHVVADERLVLGVNDRAGLAHVRRLAQLAINERHMLAGVSIVDPRATVIDVDVRIGQDTTIEPFTTIRGATKIGEGCTGAPLLPDRLHARGWRERRAVRLPAPGCGAARGREGRHVRRDQELGHRRRGEGPASLLHRRRGRRRGHEPRREHGDRQLRRLGQAPHVDRAPRAQRGGHDVRGAGDRRRRRLHGGRLGRDKGRRPGCAGGRARAPAERRGLRAAPRRARAHGRGAARAARERADDAPPA